MLSGGKLRFRTFSNLIGRSALVGAPVNAPVNNGFSTKLFFDSPSSAQSISKFRLLRTPLVSDFFSAFALQLV